MFYLEMASNYAKVNSGCTKVSVGSCIVKNDSIVSMGANRTIPNLCKLRGCLRIEKYGDNFKSHRNPEDCRAIHSEVDAIGKACRNGISLDGATIFITRYPCEACARLIVTSGIKKVIYGRDQKISELTRKIFEDACVEYYNETDYKEADTID